MALTLLDFLVLSWFLFLWIGYSFYLRYREKQGGTLAAELARYRKQWAQNVVRSKTTRVHDAAILKSLSSMANFLATTCIFILAGLIALAAKVSVIDTVLNHYSIVYPTTVDGIMIKIIFLSLIFMAAFFRLTWAMRQFSICAIMLGAAPYAKADELDKDEEIFAEQMARVNDLAGHDFNFGLRSFYFAFAVLFWFVHPIAFLMASSFITVAVYRQDFKSNVSEYLRVGRIWKK